MVDRIIVILDGAISESGTYDELISHEGPFANFLQQYMLKDDDEQEIDPEGLCVFSVGGLVGGSVGRSVGWLVGWLVGI